ncbi:MAG: phosphonate metabolism protein/1,5-bisphosphokinase (PRPP-forming) PhnN [Neptuniibacter sp.]
MNTFLYYIIGASGAGKDSLISFARHNIFDGANVAFAHRYITRDADSGSENHISLSPREFSNRLAKGCFVMNWSSHGLDYGIGTEVLEWQNQGLSVVINGSRQYLPEAVKKFPDLKPILIDVDINILEQRLTSRGRESKDEIAKRLQRAQDFSEKVQHPHLKRVSNNGSIEDAGKKLISLLTAENAL